MADRRARPGAADNAADSELLYVYAVVGTTSLSLDGQVGVGGAGVGLVRHGRLGAVVSGVDSERVRPARANVIAHQQLVNALHSEGPVLPVRFGTVMHGAQSVIDDLLEPEGERIEDLLSSLEGKDEYRLKARYEPDVALREVVEGQAAVRRLRARVQTAGRAANQGDQVRLGEMVVAALEQVRYRDAASMLDRIAPHVVALDRVDDRSDDVPLHVALLVDRRRLPSFEAELVEISRLQKGRIHLELIGPLPAWDFSGGLAGAA